MHGCMCIFCGEYACIQTGVLSTMHVQVCLLNRSCDISLHICVHTSYRICICAHVCAGCSFSVQKQRCGGSASLWKHLLLGVGGYFWQKRDRGVVCVFSIFDLGGSVCGCMCVYMHTHTHTAHMGYLVVPLRAQGSWWDTWKAWRIQMD